MLRCWKRYSLQSAWLILGLLVAIIPTLVSASQPPDSPLPTPEPPEPYPNSNIYPADVYLRTQDDLQILYRLKIDIDGFQPMDGARNLQGSAFEPSFGIAPQSGIVPTDLSNPAFDPGPLFPRTTYYWQVTAYDGLTSTIGPIRRFTTTSGDQSIFLPLTVR